jgi:PAS domain-containing protein
MVDDHDELGDEFWGAVDYCAYLRCVFGGCGGAGQRRVFVNGAYARLVGVSRDEIMQRWGRRLACPLDSDDALLSVESIRTAAEPSKSRRP